jgi:lipoprotein-anchoring transpeptidase ErfK/SrfK
VASDGRAGARRGGLRAVTKNRRGAAVSSGCIRMTNRDVTDLYDRLKVGTKVIVRR